MKTTAPIFFLASSLLSAAVSIPSATSTYTLKIVNALDPRLNGSTVVVKDESAGATFPNPLGTFSTGEPRHAYSFTLSPVSVSDSLYELKSTVKQTHLILNGDPIAPRLFETPLGEDPAPVPNKTVTRNKFLVKQDESGSLILRGIRDGRSADGTYDGAAQSWRACNGSTIDYQLYWFDGLSNLTAVAGLCESVTLEIVEVVPSVTTSIVPATTFVSSRYTTGAIVPTTSCIPGTSTSTTGIVTSVPVPTPSSTIFPQITIRIYNDETGANAAATVSANGVPHNISDLFRGSAIDKNGDIIGTSAQLVQFLDSTKCSMVNVNVRDWVVELDGRAKNFVDLDRDTSKAIPVWLGGFTFTCEA